jgi:predicted enzyme related to lactoylglutathione lyase
MLKVTEIAFSCHAVTDMARARKFYEDVLGLKPTHVCQMAMFFDPDGNTLCIHKRKAK